MQGLVPAKIVSVDPAKKLYRVEIQGMTPPEGWVAEVLYPIGDDGKQTDRRLLVGAKVWVEFMGGDSNHPIIVGHRNGKAVDIVKALNDALHEMFNSIAWPITRYSTTKGDAYIRVMGEKGVGLRGVDIDIPPECVLPFERGGHTIGFLVSKNGPMQDNWMQVDDAIPLDNRQMVRLKMPRMVGRFLTSYVLDHLAIDDYEQLPLRVGEPGGSLLEGSEQAYRDFVAMMSSLTNQTLLDAIDELFLGLNTTDMTDSQRKTFKSNVTEVLTSSAAQARKVVASGKPFFGKIINMLPVYQEKQLVSLQGDLGVSGRKQGDYNSYNQGTAGDSRNKPQIDLSNMTLAELMRRQALPKNHKDRIFAAGKYQTIPSTTKAAVSALKINPNQKFTPELQERIFAEYLTGEKRKSLQAYRAGLSNDETAAGRDLALEFASVALPRGMKTQSGRISDGTMTYYDEKGGNRASITADRAIQALRQDRANARRQAAPTMEAATVAAPATQNRLENFKPSQIKAEDTIQPAPKLHLPNNAAGLAEHAESLERPAPNTLQQQSRANQRQSHENWYDQHLFKGVGQSVEDRLIAHAVTGGIGWKG